VDIKEPPAAHDNALPQKKTIPGVNKVIAVGSGKGGVGKTTVAVNLAVALAERGLRVGLLDADVYGPNVPRMLGVEGLPQADESGKIVPLENYGVRIMSMGFFVNADTPVIWRGPMVGKLIEQFVTDVDWGQLDFLLIDLPPGTGDAQLSLSQVLALDGVVIVSTPQRVALDDAIKGLLMFQKVEAPITGVIENMSYFVCPHCGERTDIFDSGKAAAECERLGVPFLGQIPLDPSIRQGSDEGFPVLRLAPKSPQAEAFRQVAERLATADKPRTANPLLNSILGGKKK
jgi:ATP-binding protein involved in chromosome partitioning